MRRRVSDRPPQGNRQFATMSDAPKPDRWNSLLETLGVPASELPPPPPPAPPAAARPASPPGPRGKPAAKTRPANRPTSSWSAIAGSLGLEVPPEPVAPAPPPVQPLPPRPSRPSGPPPATRPLRDEFIEPELDLDDLGPIGADEPPPVGPSPKLLDEEEDNEGPILDYDVDSDLDLRLDEDFEAPTDVHPPRDDDRTAEGRSEVDRSRGQRERSPRGETAGREAAGPEGEPREGDQREGGRRRRRRGRGRGGRRDEGRREEGRREEGRPEAAPRSSEYSPPRERAEQLPPLGDEIDDVFGELPELDEEEIDLPRSAAPPAEGRAVADDREGGGRRRRRRRGRGGRTDEGRGEPRRDQRGDRRAARPAPPRDARDIDALDSDMRDDEGDEEDLLPRPQPAAPARSSVADDIDAEMDEDSLEDREGGHPVHKKIPTWEDAVGLLIEANMASRASSPDRSRGRRGRGGR